MSRLLAAIMVLAVASPCFADDKSKPNTLTPKEIAEGWILLFDGESTFGWTLYANPEFGGELKVKDGKLVMNGDAEKYTRVVLHSPIPWYYELRADLEIDGKASLDASFSGHEDTYSLAPVKDATSFRIVCAPQAKADDKLLGPIQWFDKDGKVVATEKTMVQSCGNYHGPALSFTVKNNAKLAFRNVKLRPLNATPMFTGKNLDGWKVNAADPKRLASKWEVTKDGELSVKNGPGDLVSEKEFGNFVLQFECKTNGKALNSGFFFRCIPGQYQNGYEAQIQNAYKDDDRTKPADFGTGAIYRRIPARKVVSNDNEWFTMTVVANGKQISTWVNGYQTVDWTDDRKENENPRQGFRAAKGPISIQGHDPTTDILFRNIRIAEVPK